MTHQNTESSFDGQTWERGEGQEWSDFGATIRRKLFSLRDRNIGGDEEWSSVIEDNLRVLLSTI